MRLADPADAIGQHGVDVTQHDVGHVVSGARRHRSLEPRD